MKNYEYTNTNRLQNPHKYMYTTYQGSAFISLYLKDREAHARRFELQELTQELSEIDLYLCDSSLSLIKENCCSLVHESIKSINNFDKRTSIITEELLMSLIGCQFSNNQDKRHKDWIDFLVQRFEVTKKLYEIYYSTNLRKGDGRNEKVRLYWLFSLLLTLQYTKTSNIKYLSTLLKVNDLICSLDDNILKEIPKRGLLLALLKEMEIVSKLSKNTNGDELCT